jgi:hypothetical protein
VLDVLRQHILGGLDRAPQAAGEGRLSLESGQRGRARFTGDRQHLHLPAIAHAHAPLGRTAQTWLASRAGLAYSGLSPLEELHMPTRIASMTKRLAANGQALHRAMVSRMETSGVDKQPSEAETTLLEERRLLKEERDKRQAQSLQPRASALDRLVRTHHPEAREKKVGKEAHEAKETKKPKPRRTRAEKHAEKAAALEAARRSPKKPAK